MKPFQGTLFLAVTLMLSSCSPDATMIRKRGYIGETAHRADDDFSTQESRLDHCLARGAKRYSSSTVIRVTSPTLDAATRETQGEFAFELRGMRRQQRHQLREKRVMWVYGHLVIAHPNDALLKEVQRWTLWFAKRQPVDREVPIVEWTAEKSGDAWRSNVFAVQFNHGIFQAVGLDRPDTLNEPPMPHFLPYRMSDIEDRASDIAIPGEIPNVQFFLPKFAGVFRFRATAIEFISGEKTFCLPAEEP